MLPFDPITFVSVFLGSLILDIVWAFTIRRVAQGRAFQAASYSLFTTLINGVIITEFVRNWWYLLPSAAGAFIGNYLTVKFDSRPLHRRRKKLTLKKKVS